MEVAAKVAMEATVAAGFSRHRLFWLLALVAGTWPQNTAVEVDAAMTMDVVLAMEVVVRWSLRRLLRRSRS